MTNAPIASQLVNQNFFIEAQGGSQHPISYLDRFPDNVYTKALDSNLVHFMYGLLGPAGVGGLIQNYLEARLQFEEAGLSTVALDNLYTSPFAFARLVEETYDVDANASLLIAQDRAQIVAKDAEFRNRATDYFKAIRAGGTVTGIGLAAKSGLAHAVDVIENYQALYDQYCDVPLGLPYLGASTNLNEIIIIPRQEIPHNSQQTLALGGFPTSGWCTITYPAGPDYQVVQIDITHSSNVIDLPSAVPVDTYVSITADTSNSLGTATPVTYAQVGEVLTPTSVALVHPPQSSSAGQPYDMTASTGRYWALIGNAQTALLPYNASAGDVARALWSLSAIDNGNVIVTGGPWPDQPIVVEFVRALGDTEVQTLQVNLAPDIVVGIGNPGALSPLVPQLSDIMSNPIPVFADVNVDVAGVSADGQTSTISPRDSHAMQQAIDRLRPITSFVTTTSGESVTRRQPANNIFAGSSYTEVLRYVIGTSKINWPPLDKTHWIENGKEHEAPRLPNDLQHHYQGFHNISNIIAYTEGALTDSEYSDLPPSGVGTPIWVRYYDSMIGVFSTAQRALYPMLAQFTDTNARFDPLQAIASSPDPLVITPTPHNIDNTGVINGMYPTNYVGLPGAPQQRMAFTFWASSERSTGVDYLEIDLGTVQAVNFLYFDATTKPYQIDVAYDTLDQGRKREFVPVTLVSPSVAPSVTNLVYNVASTNPWSTVTINFTNRLGGMIYTRYIRIGFARSPGGSPFMISPNKVLPYSIEVHNLRVGRNIASTDAPSNTFTGPVNIEVITTQTQLLLHPSFMMPTEA